MSVLSVAVVYSCTPLLRSLWIISGDARCRGGSAVTVPDIAKMWNVESRVVVLNPELVFVFTMSQLAPYVSPCCHITWETELARGSRGDYSMATFGLYKSDTSVQADKYFIIKGLCVVWSLISEMRKLIKHFSLLYKQLIPYWHFHCFWSRDNVLHPFITAISDTLFHSHFCYTIHCTRKVTKMRFCT